MVDVRSVFAARDALLTAGAVPRQLRQRVRPMILQSWQRSIASGAYLPIPVKEPDERWLTRASLRRAADPVLAGLAERLVDLETGLLLADQNAVILRRWIPDHSIEALLDSVNSDVGYNVAEDLVGTNGVGTVIETGQATQITGPEHLSTVLQTFTCVGAPIHNPLTRRLEGVITLSCLSDASNVLLTPLLTSTAREIEHRMLELASTHERLLLDAFMRASKSRRAPVAAVGSDLFLAGPQVTELLRDIDHAMLWEYVRSVAAGARTVSGNLESIAERLHVAHCETIESDGAVIGTIVEFDLGRREGTPLARAAARAATTRRGAALPGKSASLADAMAHGAHLASLGTSILIEGEPGVGKLTLAEAIIDSVGATADDVAKIDVAALSTDTTFADELPRVLERRPSVVLVTHLESLPASAAAAAASLLEEAALDGTPPRVIGTLTCARDGECPAGLQRLVDVIGVGRVVIPPLRDRREDISEAATSFLRTHNGGRSLTLSSAALRVLICAPWPGNLRQLDTTIRGLVSTTTRFEILPEDLPADLRAHARRRQLSTMEELELSAILDALQRHHGNKFAAANAIGISRSTLYRKLRSYHVDPDRMYF
ncbi:MAG: sigma-54 dependent transcriptional regulator, acetoin dehydrogenase operon transcriptional [Pseudonocardiales bacterium]|nr:sigma-54 dependent transcriptional regulator, acetoin dehydrogenase operon transcriptional [Pseudonocardiales bacterium]